ncbi:S8 family peptidase [Cyberlindnera jadinii NRRL Y-1542]|uniref:Subtilisin-like protein n=1 Tax=Cyberlindnera jadinii (strain ATCC 18201 / CBS 1600 / BCRC 20928 / JCM 3617 / NBRC 0987 / NRRL Y-1542) TaxID=983966 RepID=A0A1E4RVN8_CYBJN|nr:subtilisin-like protein [Cyberlindnera jadinii NRRL Y-1542]ODV71318.1 subtilisin-like protein [Cyberlindnera jadinii NRRL Y-1542]
MLKSCLLIGALVGFASSKSYIVQLVEDTSSETFLRAQSHVRASHFSLMIRQTITIGALEWLVMDIEDEADDSSSNAVEIVQMDPLVASVEPNAEVYLMQDDPYGLQYDPYGLQYEPEEAWFDAEGVFQYDGSEVYEDVEPSDSDANSQFDAPEHLARISRREGVWLSQKPYSFPYDGCGEGVTAYVIDTGVETSHPQFEGRARQLFNAIDDEPNTDLNGHGTHVAGLVGSKTYGSAKCVDIVGVKSLSATGSGNISTILLGIEFAVNHCKEHSETHKCVINMSLGAYFMSSVNDACDAASELGVVVVAAAGNSAVSASITSPLSARSVIAVGAMDSKTDSITNFSNYGQSVATFAPGWEVESLDFTNFGLPVRYSGTSMASPIVAGVCCVLLSKGVEPKDMKQVIVETSTEGAMSHSLNRWRYYSTPDRVIYMGPPTESKRANVDRAKGEINRPKSMFKQVDVPGQLDFDVERDPVSSP